MKKLLIVALLLALLVPMVIETSFAQETEVAPSSDQIFRRTIKYYPSGSNIPNSLGTNVVVYQNKVYRGILYQESVHPEGNMLRVYFSGYLTFTGIYQYSGVTLY